MAAAAHPPATSVTNRLVAAYLREGIPFSVQIDPTQACDLRCAHCYLEEPAEVALDTQAWQSVFHDLADLGVFQLTVSGGEPFLRRDLFDLLEGARGLRFAIVLKTHGGHIDAEIAAQLRRLNIQRVDVSLYAMDPSVHDAITGVEGSHGRALAAVHALRDRGQRVRISCPVMRANLSEVEAVARWATQHALELGTNAGLLPGNRGRALQQELGLGGVSVDEYVALERRLGLAPADDDRGAGGTGGALCGAARLSAYIGPNGEVRPCVMWPEAAGNVRETAFSRLWRESPILAAARSVVAGTRPDCGGCAHRSFCSACAARSRAEVGDAWRPAEFDCALARARAAHARGEKR